MKAQVISIEGKKVSEVELPKQFSAKVDKELIKRAVLSTQSANKQLNYPTPLAGRENTADYIGARHKPQMHRTINVGHARKPRLKNRRGILSGRVAGIPAVVGGPKAHPPKAEKDAAEKINKKEKRKAIASAIAATADKKLVAERGHIFDDKISFPIVVGAEIEGIEKTSEVRKAFMAMGVWSDVERAIAKRQIRAGKGTKRGRKYKKRKSILIVAKESDRIYKAARNLEGVDIVNVKDVNADALAPGALPGRLTLWSLNAIKGLGEEKNETVKAEKKAGAKASA